MGTGSPAACQTGGGGGSLTLDPGITSYTYLGLAPATKYTFRVCTTDGTSNITQGSVISFDTNPEPMVF